MKIITSTFVGHMLKMACKIAAPALIQNQVSQILGTFLILRPSLRLRPRLLQRGHT